MNPLTLGYSPCPNDTFIFYALMHGRIRADDLFFNEVLLDVETLNQKATKAELDISKISYHAFGHLRKDYCLLRSGGALGRGCGPIVITREKLSMDELTSKKIAIPGMLTTASLLLQLYYISECLDPPDFIVLPFDQIMDCVAQGRADAGLIIHESRFTYPSYGLQQAIDLGNWWEKETNLPIPLGGIIARRSLGIELITYIETSIRQSIEYAFQNRSEPEAYIKNHSQELSNEVIRQHIELYVNNFSLDIGDEGERAVREFLRRAELAGILPESEEDIFI